MLILRKSHENRFIPRSSCCHWYNVYLVLIVAQFILWKYTWIEHSHAIEIRRRFFLFGILNYWYNASENCSYFEMLIKSHAPMFLLFMEIKLKEAFCA